MSAAPSAVFDGAGQRVQLGAFIAKGGEGSIYALVGDPSRVAKIYHEPGRINAEKLVAMVRGSSPSLSRISAWPERTLNARPGGPLIGFVMPRANGLNLSELLGPGSRKAEFPDATYAFVIRTAVNLSKAFAITHASGAVVGDVKEVNELVSKQAMVTLVDTDGFQIRDPQTGKIFKTLAVTPTHQPPELQGIADFSAIMRTPDHDAFGLAVLIFQLLFMGRHPFTGVPVAHKDLEIPQAIKALQFSWAPTLAQRLYAQPPGTLSLASVGPLGPLFVRAFLPGQPGGRPSSSEWATILTTYEQRLTKCKTNPAHSFLGSVCPLCQIESQTGTLLFLGPLPAGMDRVFDLVAVWTQIANVGSPGNAPAFPASPARAPVPAAVAVGKVRRRQKWMAAGVAAIGVVAFYVIFVMTKFYAWWVLGLAAATTWAVWAQGTSDAALYVNANRAARKHLADLRKQWDYEAGEGLFVEKRRALESSREALRSFDIEKAARLQELRTNARQHQLDRFLSAQRIAIARIPNIGAGRITTLRSYNIETAFDISPGKLAYVHGFGPKLQGNLYAWRSQVERNFRFDPAKGVDIRDLQDLEREFAGKRAQHEQLLRLGPVALKSLADQAVRRRQEMAPLIAAAAADLAQTEANASAAT